jgi:hypothetical protein
MNFFLHSSFTNKQHIAPIALHVFFFSFQFQGLLTWCRATAYLCGVHPAALLTYTIQTYNIIYIYIYIWSATATNNFFILQILTTCFGPYGPSSCDTYQHQISYSCEGHHTITLHHYFHDYVAYLLLFKLTVFHILQLFLVSLKYTVKLVQGRTWIRRKLAQCEQIL